MTGWYDCNELRRRAINGDQNAVNELGEWFSRYGMRNYNGVSYDVGGFYRLYPIYEEVDEDEYELRGYELK